jgi:hypothetical protein
LAKTPQGPKRQVAETPLGPNGYLQVTYGDLDNAL